MYSKAGRATTEIFTVLQHGEEILQPKVKFFKAHSSSLVQTVSINMPSPFINPL